ncbi:MAG: hypothetical protein A2Y33_04180 [Spirochaetes bacterium GWF1_51_8]|nr:MAG: hypothetical protein A2Y33_04180 [Spirochaetes bacterium GWF1_51_8]
MSVFRLYLFILIMFTAVSLFYAEDADETVIASYMTGGKKVNFYIGDIRKELFYYAVQKKIAPEDLNSLKSFVTESLVIQELKAMDMIESGYTNRPEFKLEYDKAVQQMYLSLLKRYGDEIVRKLLKDGQFLLARASHILFAVNPYSYDENHDKIGDSPEIAGKKWAEAKKMASSTIEELKAADDLDSVFAQTAGLKSQDPGSAARGGDLGYFPKGQMVSEFGDAVFGQKTKGVIGTPVKTDYGYHVVYVTVPPKMMSYKDLENEVGQEADRIWFAVESSCKTENTKMLYALDNSNSNIVIGDKSYKITELPDDAVVMEIWGTSLTWKKSREIIDVFVPGFSDNISFFSFGEQMRNCMEFMFYAELALTKGIGKSPEFTAEYSKNLKKVLINLCTAEFDKMQIEAAKKTVTPSMVLSYYESHFEEHQKWEITTKEKNFLENLKPVRMFWSLKKATNQIVNILVSQQMETEKESWKKDVFEKYQVGISEEGLKVLSEKLEGDLDAYYQEVKKKKEEWEKKQLENQIDYQDDGQSMPLD